jgi:hypothetical protein
MRFTELNRLSPLGQLSLIAAGDLNWQNCLNRPNRLNLN